MRVGAGVCAMRCVHVVSITVTAIYSTAITLTQVLMVPFELTIFIFNPCTMSLDIEVRKEPLKRALTCRSGT